MKPNTFDVVPRHKSITVFKAGSHWIFKHFFDDREIFRSWPITTTRTSIASNSRR